MERPGAGSETRAVLDDCSAFAELPASLLDQLYAAMRERRYEPGTTLIRQGDPGDFLLLMIDGEARAFVVEDGGERHEVGRFGRACVIGELALITREPRSADVVADTPVRALVLPADDFHRLATANIELTLVLTRLVAERLGRGQKDGLGGKLLNGHRIRRCVGRGGMAVVYEAEEQESGRTVALKMMNHSLVYEPGALARFRQEADLVQTLEHENLARLYGRFAAYRTSFLVMEFVDGADFRRLISVDGLPEALVRKLIGQLAAALSYVHGKGVLHRDLKPGNVMLTRQGKVKLMDFGLARPQVHAGDATMTRSGALMGTPTYMAPEQFAGLPPDSRADVYALALICLELLRGRRTFDSSNVLSLVQDKLNLKVPPARSIGTGISEEMHTFLRDALGASPGDRPGSLGPVAAWAAPLDENEITLLDRFLRETPPHVK